VQKALLERTEIAKLLMDKGADVNPKSADGYYCI